PLVRSARFFPPHSGAARAAGSAAARAANGVDFLEPLKPAAPGVAHAWALPGRSVMVTMVLLNEAWMWAMPAATFFFTFFRTRAAAVGAAGGFAMGPRSLSAGLRGGGGNLDSGLARTLPGACVGAGTLAANRQSLAMTGAPIAAEVHQPLDVHRHLAAQV